MYNKLFLLFLLVFECLNAQQTYKITGSVNDKGTNLPLEAVSVYNQETKKGTSTDLSGFFELKNLSSGSYHLVFSHLGCESEHYFIQLKKDTVLNITMEHSLEILENVLIHTKPKSTQTSKSINEKKLTDNADKNLASQLSSITGVSLLKNGNGVAKPVIQGLFGNRITILNNGITQSGQQWGNDHSPEIDPLSANKIRVIKGASALEYMGSNLGGIILVEPGKIIEEPHLHGKTTYFFESNGLSNGVNLQLQQHNEKLAWKVSGTLKKSGDRNTPDYFLNNTGNQEANIALQLEKSFSKKFKTNLYFSSFNTEIGILRGAHVGNGKDLSEAFLRAEPFFTEADFSYAIDAPKQKVNHQLLKLQGTYDIDDSQVLKSTFALQINDRKEFDVRRANRTNTPTLSLEQYAFFIENTYKKSFENETDLKLGLQFNFIDNTNQRTGTLPLIPDYFSMESGFFTKLTKRFHKSIFETAVRYDNAFQNVAAIQQSVPRSIVRYENNFHNLSASTGWLYAVSEKYNLNVDLGYALRNPGINELYSNGLHQGVASIELGDPNLNAEKSLKGNLNFNGTLGNSFFFESLLYFQKINDYIFLKPQREFLESVRGRFPIYKYEQTNAQIYGWDFSGKYQISQTFYSKLTYSYIKGDDLSTNKPLITMPANNLGFTLNYEFPHAISIGKKKLENLEIQIHDRYVFKQTHILDEQLQFMPDNDFVFEAPNAYNLIHLKVATNLQLHHSRLRLTFKIDNLLNTRYRDYLDRLRYFSDSMGMNAIFGLSLKF